ncbi:M1 family metallopeptidase [Pontixanthobacter gangjinensis]|uniref:Aminopeptidase N n=1 Tax=Pontixanthobacter gangjinensis TaxID=1028742 RepID=A0A6I4SMA6_9SPHN|nr:M1 family metallopeptidase [Pontixanthobacter gangjinensis]MXO56286.1 aminopeptidase [Pontixanthobacter gangjinensis]
MRFSRGFAAAFSLLLVSACNMSGDAGGDAPKVAPILTTEDAKDDQSFAQPELARVTHVDLELDLDFDKQTVSGSAMLDIIAEKGVDIVVLDDDGLKIETITDADGKPLDFTVGEVVEGKGAPLSITMGDAREITITYSASDAAALQWLSPEQTAGGKHPYLLSQGQATLNRTWIPTQDSPGIRQTWAARITAPDELTVVMSGLSEDEPETLDDGRRAFTFEMDKPVAPYLIAIAAGDIVFKELGPRSGVWSEPSMIDAAAAELTDTEAMIDAAEKLYGDYRWGRYDMIVLPPAFPYGGMENPVMTFLTPTFIAGDRSLTGLVAHELAHSWSGNLVTNANWTDSWLNEGVTSYFENRIVEEIYGKKRADQEAALSFAAIEDTLAEVGTDDPGTALHQPVNVDSIGSAIVYDKGAFFLRTVESIVGRDRFDAWLQQWFDNHAFQPATSAMILADMEENLVKDEAEAEQLQLREWIYGTGLPDNVARPDPAAFAEVDAAARAFSDKRKLDTEAWDKWTSAERQRFLAKIPRKLNEAELAGLDEGLKLSASTNNEELFLWLELALQNKYEAAVPTTEQFLARVGRRKFVAPLFEALMDQGAWGQPIAKRIYAKTRASYHSVTQGTVDGLVKG